MQANENTTNDPVLLEAKEWSRKEGYVSISFLQRILRIGYTRAARIVDLLVEQGFCEAEFIPGTMHRALVKELSPIKNADGHYTDIPA